MKQINHKIALLSIIIALSSCGNKEADEVTTAAVKDTGVAERIFVSKVQFEQSKMKLDTLMDKSFPVTVKTNGMIDVPPESRAVLTATMGGYIKTVPYLIGDKVSKGQALITLENPEFISIQQAYMEVKGELTYLKAEYDRQKTMRAENITSKKSFLQAESAYQTAYARYNGLRKQLQILNISPKSVEAGNISSVITLYAPISGSITKVNVTRGSYVSPATAIVEIVNNEHIHIELSVFEKDIMKLKIGQPIRFQIPESSAVTYEAKVHLIGTAIENNRTIKVHGHLENEEGTTFLPGMFVDAEIVTESAFAKAVPETAIVTVDDSAVILKLDQETEEGYYFNMVKVATGITANGVTALTEMAGLTHEDRILTKGAFNLVTDE